MDWGNKFAISVAGGKGGTGKSSFSANLAVALANTGKNVVLVDADLGTANLHTMLGITYPDKSLKDFLNGNTKTLEETLLTTDIENLKLLSSASDLMSIVLPNYREKQRLFKAINKLETDVVIFDIAAGAHQRSIDFFTLAPMGIIILQPQPTSVENAFSFLKNLLMRHLLRVFYHNKEMNQYINGVADPQKNKKAVEFNSLLDILQEKAPGEVIKFKREIYNKEHQLYIVANSVKNKQQEEIADKFSAVVKKYLLFDMEILGKLPFDPFMDNAICTRTPFITKYPDSDYSFEIIDMASKVSSIIQSKKSG